MMAFFKFYLADDELPPTGKVSKSCSDTWPVSIVDEELKSMVGTEDIVNENMRTLVRPRETAKSRERMTKCASPVSSSSSTSLLSPEKKPRGSDKGEI